MDSSSSGGHFYISHFGVTFPLGRPNLQPWSAYATDPVGGRNPRVGRPTLTDGAAPASRAGTRSAAETCRSGRELSDAAPAARAVGG